jgi:hypothetical protein
VEASGNGITQQQILTAVTAALDEIRDALGDDADEAIAQAQQLIGDRIAAIFEHLPDEERPTPAQVAAAMRRHFELND